MSTSPREIERKSPPPQPKQTANDNIRPRSREQEIENLKRLMAHISQRLDGLK